MLDDGEVECEIEKVLAQHDTKTGRRLSAGKLRNAADVVQDYLDESSSKVI